MGMFVELEGGLVFTTTIFVKVCGVGAVMNCVECEATVLPAMSLTPAIASVITVDPGSVLCGVICTTWLLLLKLIDPGVIGCPPPLTWIVVPFTVIGSIAPLNCT